LLPFSVVIVRPASRRKAHGRGAAAGLAGWRGKDGVVSIRWPACPRSACVRGAGGVPTGTLLAGWRGNADGPLAIARSTCRRNTSGHGAVAAPVATLLSDKRSKVAGAIAIGATSRARASSKWSWVPGVD